jgi:hypothetical protein
MHSKLTGLNLKKSSNPQELTISNYQEVNAPNVDAFSPRLTFKRLSNSILSQRGLPLRTGNTSNHFGRQRLLSPEPVIMVTPYKDDILYFLLRSPNISLKPSM